MNEKIKALETVEEYIDILKKGILETAGYFQNGEEYKGNVFIPDITEGIQWIIDVIILTRDVQVETIDVSELKENLQEIVIAFESEDYILIGDLFEYEIVPIFEEIQNKIKLCL